MLPESLSSLLKRCLLPTRRLLLVPLVTLALIVFLFNAQISFHPLSSVCYPKKNVMFLKTHKCAGSSIQNILMRFGDTHHLNFVLPRVGNYLGHPAPFSRSMVNPSPRDFNYNILSHHTRFNYDEIKAIMPRDTVFVTIVRDPIQLFESSYFYYGFDKIFKRDIHAFIQNLPRFSNDFLSKRFRGKFGANQIFFDLGGDPKDFRNEAQVTEYIEKLDSWFHLVLIAEMMDKSLVLLRHLMCWDIEDVITFKLNARDPKFKSDLSNVEKDKLRQLNNADELLYKHFLKRFDREVELFGRERLESEAAELRQRTEEWYEFCVEDLQPHVNVVTPKHYYNPRVMMFETKNVTNSTCSSLTMEELEYTDLLRKRQMELNPSSFQAIPIRNKRKHKDSKARQQTNS